MTAPGWILRITVSCLVGAEVGCTRELHPPPSEEPLIGTIVTECTTETRALFGCFGVILAVHVPENTASPPFRMKTRILVGVEKNFPPLEGGIFRPRATNPYGFEGTPDIPVIQILPRTLVFDSPIDVIFDSLRDPSPLFVFFAREEDPDWTLVGSTKIVMVYPRHGSPSHVVAIDRPGLWAFGSFITTTTTDGGLPRDRE